MSELITTPNIEGPDDIYDHLIRLHAGMSESESQQLNAKLILLLINHIGDKRVVLQAIAAAAAAGAALENPS